MEDAIILCGVNDNVLFNGATRAQRISSEVFDDEFESCLDKTFKEFKDDMKSYSNLTVINGQIRLNPAQKKNIKAFIQWVKDLLRTGQDPSANPFPIDSVSELIKLNKTHEAFLNKSSTLSEASKPDSFKDKSVWKDWKPTFVNYLRHIPDINGVPLIYVIRYYCTIENNPNDMLNDYIRNAPHEGEAFNTDNIEVHTYLAKFVKGNTNAESRITSHGHPNNGLKDMKALTEQYEGVGVNATDVKQAETDIDSLFYNGEKRPHMWWSEFERRLTLAFSTIDKHENREVYSNDQKLRLLNKKINADFLQHTRTVINTEMSRVPMTMTYVHALATYRNAVLDKFSV